MVMTLIKYVSVKEYADGPREGETWLEYGKADEEGSDVLFGTPSNDIDGVHEANWERLLVYELPREMEKVEAKQWLEKKQPEGIFDAMEGSA